MAVSRAFVFHTLRFEFTPRLCMAAMTWEWGRAAFVDEAAYVPYAPMTRDLAARHFAWDYPRQELDATRGGRDGEDDSVDEESDASSTADDTHVSVLEELIESSG